MEILTQLSNTTESFTALVESAQSLAEENQRMQSELTALQTAMEKLAQEKASAQAESEYWRIRYTSRENFKPSPVVAKRRKRAG